MDSYLFKFDLVRSSFIPPKDIRALREIARYRFKLVYMKASEKKSDSKLYDSFKHWYC